MNKRRVSVKVLSIAVLLLVIIVFSGAIFHTQEASASLTDDIMKKVKYNTLESMYLNNKMISPVDLESISGTIPISAIVSSADVMSVRGVAPTYASSETNLYINDTNQGFFDGIRQINNTTSYVGLLRGNNSFTLSNLGYTAQAGSSDSSKCIQLSYKVVEGGHSSTKTSNKLCFPVDSDGYVNASTSSSVTSSNACSGTGCATLRYADGGILYLDVPTAANSEQQHINLTVDIGSLTSNKTLFDGPCDAYGYGGLVCHIESILSNRSVPLALTGGGEIPFSGSNGASVAVSPGTAGSAGNKFEIKSTAAAAQTALAYFTGNPSASFEDYRITTDDYAKLYRSYVDYVIRDHKEYGITLNTDSCSDNKDSFSSSDYIWTENGTTWCKIDGNVDGVNLWFGGRKSQKALQPMKFSEILKDATQLDLSQVSSGSFGTVGGSPAPGENGGDPTAGDASMIAPCYNAAGVLGWIVCPVLGVVSDASEFLYDHFVEPALQVQAGKIMDRNSGTYTGWQTFRTFANILFGIAFVVVIFSQITGIGISNYNVKKMLPRFIMIVVLVNISFILCQLAVDLSNILGSGLKSLFEGLPAGVEFNVGDIIKGIAKTLGVGAIGVGGAAFAAGGLLALAANLPYWILMLLISLISVLFSVIFFFIVMAVRQAGVVILVVLSPVAIVCYALPNTKSLFDKWKKMFTSLLMVYPIAGLLMGAGTYAGALLMGISQEGDLGVFYTLSAMIISVVPFFAIPSLVKGSLAMAGNLGMRLSQFGQSLGRGATSRVQRSRGWQEYQAEEQRRSGLRRDLGAQRRLERRAAGKGLVGRARTAFRQNVLGRSETDAKMLSNRETTRLAHAQAGINKATGMTASALKESMNNDGTVNDFDRMEAMLYEAATKYSKNKNDFEALERMNAVSEVLDGTEEGQKRLSNVISHLEFDAHGNEGIRVGTNETLRRMANSTMTHNGGNIKRESPILAQQLKNIMKMSNTNEDRGANVRGITDEGGRTTYSNIRDLTGTIGSLSPEALPGINETDLDRFTEALSTNAIPKDSDDYAALMDAISKTLTDPHIKGRVKAKVGRKMQRLLNTRFLGDNDLTTSAGVAAATNELARTDSADLGRIQDGFKQKTIIDDEQGADRTNMLNLLQQMMLRGLAGEVELGADKAAQIDKILKEQNINMPDLARSGAYSGMAGAEGVQSWSPDKFQQKYESLMGLKVNRAPRRKLSDLSGGERRKATLDDVRGAIEKARLAGEERPSIDFKVGDWVEREKDGDGNVINWRRMNDAEAQEADELLRREVADKIAQDDQEYEDSYDSDEDGGGGDSE